jgi:hypothetical protein
VLRKRLLNDSMKAWSYENGCRLAIQTDTGPELTSRAARAGRGTRKRSSTPLLARR